MHPVHNDPLKEAALLGERMGDLTNADIIECVAEICQMPEPKHGTALYSGIILAYDCGIETAQSYMRNYYNVA